MGEGQLGATRAFSQKKLDENGYKLNPPAFLWCLLDTWCTGLKTKSLHTV